LSTSKHSVDGRTDCLFYRLLLSFLFDSLD
jgi:hypothetical protein